jgi:hypothetical protein
MQRAASTLTTQPSTAQRKVVRDLGAGAASRLFYLPDCGQRSLRTATPAQNNSHRSEPAVSHYSKALFGVKVGRPNAQRLSHEKRRCREIMCGSGVRWTAVSDLIAAALPLAMPSVSPVRPSAKFVGWSCA